jgi:hypothetical protein
MNMPDANGSDSQNDHELEAFNVIVRALKSLPEEVRLRAIESACKWVGVESPVRSQPIQIHAASLLPPQDFRANIPGVSVGFTERVALSPKEFLLNKEPKTDIERIACLAYYLTHHRETQHFKTIDLSELNTEAAQPKFSNPSYALNNAIQAGYIVSAPGGQKQLSSQGEQFVLALPDREVAKAVNERFRKRRPKRPLKKT